MTEDIPAGEPVKSEQHPVTVIAYIVGNPWPICHQCRAHVCLVEETGAWKHF